MKEINQALAQLSSGKAPGNDGIPVEVIKCAKGTLLKEIHAPTLFGIFFVTLLKHAFGESTEGIYLRTRSDGNLFKL